MIMSALMKPELYFQPERKQKGEEAWFCVVPDAGDQAALQKLRSLHHWLSELTQEADLWVPCHTEHFFAKIPCSSLRFGDWG